IALSTRALLPNPWDDLPESIEIGSVVKGNVTSIQDRGICVRIKEGVEGFVHISEMTLSPYLDTPASVVEPGQEVDLQVLKIEREKQDLRLGMRQLLSDPWQASDFLEKYGLNTRHQAVVRKFAEKSKGTFFEIEPGIEGYLDNDHISWVKKILRANDYFQIGEKHEIIVLSVNEESKLLKLGMRELQDSPWDSFEESFTVGSEHDGVVKNKYRSGAIIELPYGLQAFVPNKELVKEDNNSLEEGETLKFRIIDFIKYEHKVMLSHVATYKEPSTEGERVDRPPVQVVKKATLSDLGALSKLKEKLTGKSQEGEQATKEQPEEKKNSTKKTKEKENKEEDK
ncbi:MAG: S1 RNA-binding domain-containing protein, partial [Bacteroidota bacterium]